MEAAQACPSLFMSKCHIDGNLMSRLNYVSTIFHSSLFLQPNTNPRFFKYEMEPVHEISNNVVCVTSKASDQPRSLIRAFASGLDFL